MKAAKYESYEALYNALKSKSERLAKEYNHYCDRCQELRAILNNKNSTSNQDLNRVRHIATVQITEVLYAEMLRLDLEMARTLVDMPVKPSRDQAFDAGWFYGILVGFVSALICMWFSPFSGRE